jgi:hypothetical protein
MKVQLTLNIYNRAFLQVSLTLGASRAADLDLPAEGLDRNSSVTDKLTTSCGRVVLVGVIRRHLSSAH